MIIIQRWDSKAAEGAKLFGLPNPHRLRIHEFMHSQPGQFAPEARCLNTAERQARIGFDDAVNECGAGLNVRRQLLGTCHVLASNR
jgi:hypothetical protein